VSYLFLGSFIGGLLLAVRLMFFGAERRKLRAADSLPLRRSEPAIVGFLVMLGVAGYLLTHHTTLAPAAGALVAVVVALAWAVLVTWLAIATARIRPEHNPEDPRYLLQGRIGIVIVAIPTGGEGSIRFEDHDQQLTVPARDIANGAIGLGEEICIDRIEDGLAHVEPWKLVEQRL
jgi:hypothetical protein